jgi:hypothetical protein
LGNHRYGFRICTIGLEPLEVTNLNRYIESLPFTIMYNIYYEFAIIVLQCFLRPSRIVFIYHFFIAAERNPNILSHLLIVAACRLFLELSFRIPSPPKRVVTLHI